MGTLGKQEVSLTNQEIAQNHFKTQNWFLNQIKQTVYKVLMGQATCVPFGYSQASGLPISSLYAKLS